MAFRSKAKLLSPVAAPLVSRTSVSGVAPTGLQRQTHRALAWLDERLRGYIPALVAFVAALAIHGIGGLLLGLNHLGPFPFFLYLLTFLTAAWCGYGPGLVTTILLTCGMPYLFKPGFSIRTVDWGGVAIFLLLSVIVSGIASSRRRAEALLRRLNAELSRQVSEQTRILRDQLAELETLYAKLSVGLSFLDAELRFVRVNEKVAFFHGSRSSLMSASRCATS